MRRPAQRLRPSRATTGARSKMKPISAATIVCCLMAAPASTGSATVPVRILAERDARRAVARLGRRAARADLHALWPRRAAGARGERRPQSRAVERGLQAARRAGCQCAMPRNSRRARASMGTTTRTRRLRPRRRATSGSITSLSGRFGPRPGA